MSNTVKLVIALSKEDIDFIRKTSFVEDERTMFKQSSSDRQGTMVLFNIMNSVKNGILLDNVKAEIAKPIQEECCYIGRAAIQADTIKWCLEILDNIGKAESEEV